MGDYGTELKNLERKKQKAGIETGSKSANKSAGKSAAPGSALILDARMDVSATKSSTYKSAYRQILEHDFTSQAWISKSAGKRKHRKNIEANYKTVTGKKSSDLTSDEKNQRKKEFEDRRALSVKASGLVADLLAGLSENEVTDHDEDVSFLQTVKDMDTGIFDYTGEGLAADTAFLDRFETHMPMLHRAEGLYERLHDEDSFPELAGEERMSLMARLAYMKEVRSAYEDRIRIISSPYYVSLRERDFVGSTPENLEKLRGNEKEPAPLRSYAAAVLRWRNSGLPMLRDRTLTDTEIGRNILLEDTIGRKQMTADAADRTIDGVIGKLKPGYIGMHLNKKQDTVESGMAIKTARAWVYSDLKKKVTRDEIKARLAEMLDTTERRIKDISSDPEKYRKEKEEAKNKDYEEKKKLDPKIKYRVVTKADVDLELLRNRSALAHLKNVSKRFDAKEISEEVMKLWLDRGLQHDLRMGKKIYEGIVYQKYCGDRESDESYAQKTKDTMKAYFMNLPGAVAFLQGGKVAYVRKEDEGKVTDRKALYKDIQPYPEGLGISEGKCDFIHVVGGGVKSDNVVTRAYISAKGKYKSQVVAAFTETLTGLKMQDKVYFKITTKADNGFYGMDDLTVYFTEDVSAEERKKILDTFYDKCNESGENILDGKDMCVTGTRYKDGIALAPEPSIAETLNDLFYDDSKFNDTRRLQDAQNRDSKVRKSFSYNSFITSMFCQSAITANYLLGRKQSVDINVADRKTLAMIKQVFRQLCFLNGI